MVCKCKRFSNYKATKFPAASKEGTCLDCGIGKVYWNGNNLIKIKRNE